MPTVIAAHGAVLDRVLDATYPSFGGGLNRQAYGTFYAARTKTPWGSRCQRSFALVEGQSVLASADQYNLTAVLDGRTVRLCGIGSVFAEPSPDGPDRARLLVGTLLRDAEREGAEMALLFSQG